MFNLKHFDLADVNSSPYALQTLFGIFQSTLNPDLTEREFTQYLFGVHPDSFDISLIYKDDALAGFATAAAYPKKINGKKVIILRSAFGLLDRYKEGKFPLQSLFYKYILYKLKHLFTPVYVAGFMANPLMYAMICKYTRTCYPRRNGTLPKEMAAFKDELLASMKLTKKEINPFVLKIHFQVKFRASDKERIRSSTNKDVQYFLSINPGYEQQYGVLVLVPVTVSNMIYTLFMYTIRKTKKLFSAMLQSKSTMKLRAAGA